jgi:hypothetical protein
LRLGASNPRQCNQTNRPYHHRYLLPSKNLLHTAPKKTKQLLNIAAEDENTMHELEGTASLVTWTALLFLNVLNSTAKEGRTRHTLVALTPVIPLNSFFSLR